MITTPTDKQVMNPPIELSIENRSDTFLRLLSTDDFAEIYQIVTKDRDHLQTYQRWAKDATLDSLRADITQNVEKVAKGEWLQYRIMYRDKSNQSRIIGSVTFYDHKPEDAVASLGYWITSDFEGKGYALSAAQSLRDFGFNEWGLRKIVIEIDEGNVRSEKLALRLGAKLTDQISSQEFNGQAYQCRVWEISCE